MVGCLIDISAQCRAEQSLEDLRTLKGAIIDAAIGAIVVTDLDGRIVEFNPVAETMLGHRRDAAVGQALDGLIVPAELRRRHRDRMRRFRHSGNRRLRDRIVETTAIRSRIFEPFFTTKEVGQGTGIGLAVCHRIVGSLNGEITVDSPAGRGASFRVGLPVATRRSIRRRALGRPRRVGRPGASLSSTTRMRRPR